jgi:hypothetical protein
MAPSRRLPDQRPDTHDRILQIAVWTFAIVEAVGIAFVLWHR